MKEFPNNVLEIQVNEKATKVLKTVGNINTVQYEVFIKPNLEKHKNFSKSLTKILEKISSKKTEGTLSFQYDNREKVNRIIGKLAYYSLYYYVEKINPQFLDKINKDSFVFGIETNRTSSATNLDYKLYILDEIYLRSFLTNVKNCFNEAVSPGIEDLLYLSTRNCLKLKLLDKNNEEIFYKKFSMPSLYSKWDGRFNILFLNNVFFIKMDTADTGSGQKPELILHPKLDIETEDLKKVKKIEVSIE